MRYGEGLQHQTIALAAQLEFMVQARFPDPRLPYRGDDLALPRLACSRPAAAAPARAAGRQTTNPRLAATCSRVRSGPTPTTS